MRALTAALVALAGCGAPRDSAPRVGSPVPDYAASTLEGRPASLRGLRGSPVLLNVWATWCPPCRQEMPELERLYRQHAARGLRVVGVSIDEPGQEGTIRGFLREHRVTYPIWLDPDDHVSAGFALIGVPGTFLIARDGTLLWMHAGPIRADDAGLNRALDQALR